MDSLFILNINGNPFLSQFENYIEKLAKFCPSLEIIDEVRMKDLYRVSQNDCSMEYLGNNSAWITPMTLKVFSKTCAVKSSTKTYRLVPMVCSTLKTNRSHNGAISHRIQLFGFVIGVLLYSFWRIFDGASSV
jgi:hypothetical protein